jgi:hypothetical protein
MVSGTQACSLALVPFDFRNLMKLMLQLGLSVASVLLPYVPSTVCI